MIIVAKEERNDRLRRNVPRLELIAGFIHAALWWLFPGFNTSETECSTPPVVSCLRVAARNLDHELDIMRAGSLHGRKGEKSCHGMLTFPSTDAYVNACQTPHWQP